VTGTNAIVDDGVGVAAAVPAPLAVAAALAVAVVFAAADVLELWQPASRPTAVTDTAAVNSPPLIALLP
jgi:hypothetical protein